MGSSFFHHINAKMAYEADKAIVEELEFISKKVSALDTEVFFKPSNVSITEVLDILPSEKMTMFTYTIKAGFAKIVEESLEKCTGDARLVFSFTSDAKSHHVKAVLKKLTEINNKRGTNARLELLIQNLSHIKFLQRNEHIVYGSANFSKNSDSPVPNSKGDRYPSYDELLCESQTGGEEIADLMWNFMKKKYPEITPIVIPKSSDDETIDSLLDEVLKFSDVNYSYRDVCAPVVSTSYDKDELIDGIFDILALDNSVFEDDPDLSSYELIYSEWLNAYLESLDTKAEVGPPRDLFYELDNFVEGEIAEFKNSYVMPESEIETKVGEREDELYEPTPEQIESLRDSITADVKAEKAERETSFVSSFNEKLRDLLESLILESVEDD